VPRRELITYQLHVLLRRISLLNAPSWVCSCPDIFTFLYATFIMWVLVKANHVTVRTWKQCLGQIRESGIRLFSIQHTTGVILVYFSKPVSKFAACWEKHTDFFHHLTSSFYTRNKKLKV